MSAANTKTSGGRERKRLRRRRRKLAAAAGALLMVPAMAAGAPVSGAGTSVEAGGDVGRGLFGLTDPDEVSADGQLSEDDRIGDNLLRDAVDPNLLALGAGPEVTLPSGPLGIPGPMLEAYMRAEKTLATGLPNCHLHWSLLASIGRIESNHARGGRLDARGNTVQSILGPVLNGGGFAAISDSDGGALDGDSRWDRAVGPMQFIPSTWRGYAADGNGDGIANPHNAFDATLAAGKYLCSGGLDLSNTQQRAVAVFRYNHSDSYVRTVLIWADAYARGGPQPLPTTVVPPLPGQNLALPGSPGSPGAPGTPGAPGPAPVPNQPPSSPPPSRPPSTTPSGPAGSGTVSPSPRPTTTTTTTTTTTSAASSDCQTPPTTTTTTTESTTTTTTPPPCAP